MPKKYELPVKRSPKDDPQQYRVYRMEHEAIGACNAYRLPRASIRTIVKSVCKNYGVPEPTVSWRDLGTWAAEWCMEDKGAVITFSTVKGTARDALTVTHELAHHLHWYLSNGTCEKQEAHGPEFMACHMSILDARRMIPVVGMRAVCDKYKLRYADPGDRMSLSKLIRIVRKK